jgi:cytosine deaminase
LERDIMDLIIRNAKLRDDELVDIGVEDGRIKAIRENIDVQGREEIDASGRLTIPAFIDPHIHLDKTLIADVVRDNVTGTLREAIEIIWEKKRQYTNEDIVERASRVMKMGVSNGTTRMRTHVDVDTIGGLKPLEGILAAKEKCKGYVELQIVAFPQEGIIKDDGCKELMDEAMKMGANVVGGMPANENNPDDSLRHVEFCFDLAEKYDADIDMHVDETDDPFYRTLEMVADETLKRGYYGRVTAGHTCALASYDDHYAGYVMDKVKQAEMNMITNPVTNLMLQGRYDGYPKRRGLTRVKELLNAGVNVAYGQDCIKDTFYPFGKADMLEVGLILAHAAHMSLPHEIEEVFNMPLERSARILRLTDYGIEEGKRADIVILDADNPKDALRLQSTRLYVIKEGTIVAKSVRDTRFLI